MRPSACQLESTPPARRVRVLLVVSTALFGLAMGGALAAPGKIDSGTGIVNPDFARPASAPNRRLLPPRPQTIASGCATSTSKPTT